MNRFQTSRRLAYVFGIATPFAEVIRRWGTWWDYPPNFLDDIILGALLIAGAWLSRNPSSQRGRSLLCAAWGFACGILYGSVFGHWLMLKSGEADPAPIPSEAVLGIKVLGGLFLLWGLALSLSAPEAKDA